MANRRLIRLSTIAKLTGIPRGTLSTWVHRGDKRMGPDADVDGIKLWWWPDVGVRLGVLDPPKETNALAAHLQHLNQS